MGLNEYCCTSHLAQCLQLDESIQCHVAFIIVIDYHKCVHEAVILSLVVTFSLETISEIWGEFPQLLSQGTKLLPCGQAGLKGSIS